MTRVILITFGVLGWAWFEMSGGSDFVPGENGLQVLAEARPVAAPVVPAAVVTKPSVSSTVDVVARDTPLNHNSVIVAAPVASQAPAQIPALIKTAKAIPAVVTPGAAVSPEKAVLLDTPIVMSDADATPAQSAAQSAAVVEEAVAAVVDYRTVTGSRVNLRGGPSTSFDVVAQLLRGEEVEILDDAGDGWVKLRALDGNDIGWMSDSFLTASN